MKFSHPSLTQSSLRDRLEILDMASMSTAAIYTYTILTASTIAYSPTSFLTTDRPVHLAILTLVITSILLLVAHGISRLRTAADGRRQGQYESVPLQELQHDRPDLDETPRKSQANGLTSPSLLLVMFGSTIALTLRIEILRQMLLAPECASRSKEVWLPLLIAAYDAVRTHYSERNEVGRATSDAPITKTYGSSTWAIGEGLLYLSSLRYVPAALLFSGGCYLVTGLWFAARSTLVCPLVSSDARVVPGLQWLSLILDAGLAVSAQELGHGCSRLPWKFLSIPRSWAVVTVLSTGVWTVAFVFVYILQPENHAWLTMSLEGSRYLHLIYLFCRAVFVSSFCVGTLYSIVYRGLVDVSMTLTAVFVVIPGLRFIGSAAQSYPALSRLNTTFSFLIIYVSWLLFGRTKRAISQSSGTLSGPMQFITFFFLAVLLYPGAFKTNTVDHHPIDSIIQNAQAEHATYLSYASQSKDLASAVRVYEERYGDSPPPNFDVWFQFAQNRSVWVIDEFDQIHRDLLPFRAVSAAQLRSQTRELMSDPYSGVKAICIREGKAHLQDDIVPTHRWMLEGVVRILESFVQFLPDMDIGFNLADECRVAIPYEMLQSLQRLGSEENFRGSSAFTFDRAREWSSMSKESRNGAIFEDWSLQNTYQEWIVPTCPPNSAARKKQMPLYKSQLCLDCAADHSNGQFLSNWTVAADPCHQPDLATAHGFFVSPAAFNSTHKLYPIFSQSKVGGFNDIIYPSAWNYVDKAKYAPTESSTADQSAFPDPPFEEKRPVLFWRGGTSEGISDGHGTWRGMVRQRMVHLANNLTASQYDSIDLLLPGHDDSQRFTYTAIPGSALSSLGLHADMHFVNEIVRCGGRDCDEQASELGLVDPVDFQSHWRYKYLIDLDGAGFSGRFVSFLQSRSLPFKSALFREWYDSRLTAWVHFVPLDPRLHGVWSTLAYFLGIRGTDSHGRNWNWAGHEEAAKAIAEAGREWSNKVLTKHDMEVYLFRLLLEWARLTDDRRSQLGFSLVHDIPDQE